MLRTAILTLAAAALLVAADLPPVQEQPERPEPDRRTPLRVNPPTFRWPAARPGNFELELARTADFRNPTRSRTADLFWRPLAALSPGDWHWRVRPENGEWLPPASFRIDPSLPKWTVPEWKTIAARVPRARPRIFLRPEDVAKYKARAAGPLRAGVREWTAEMERWIGKDVSGKKLEKAAASGDEAEDKLREGKVNTWQAKGDARQLMAPVPEMSWLAMLTGQQRWSDEVRRRVLLAAALDPEKDLTDRTSDFANANLVSGSAIAYDMLYDRFSPEERAAVRRMLVARATPIFRKMERNSLRPFSAHNWQHIFLNGTEGALALLGDEPVAQGWVELAVKTFVAFYPWFGGAEGGSAEGVNYYTCCGMLSSLDTHDLFRSAFQFDFARDKPWYRNNPYYLIYAIPPGGIRSPFGDVNPSLLEEKPLPRHKMAALRMAALHSNGYAADYARRVRGEGVEDRLPWFLWSGGPPVAPKSLDLLPPARAFRDIGMAFLHSALTRPDEDVRVEFRSSPYGAQGHAHFDQNSFVVIARNEPLLIDSGYYTSAGDRHHAGWTRQTKAHNSLLVDGKGQEGERGPRLFGEIVHFEQRRDAVYLVGSAANAYPETPLDRFDRHFLWLRGGPVETYVIWDDLAAAGDKPRNFDWLLHAAREMKTDFQARTVRIAGGKSEARLRFLAPRDIGMRQTNQFDPPPENWRPDRKQPLPDQWHLTVTSPAARSVRYIAVLQVGAPGFADAPASLEGDVLRVGGWKVRWNGSRLEASR